LRIFSYVGSRYEDGAWSGVPRFDFELRQVFLDLVSVRELPSDLDPKTDVVITDNHLSLDVPGSVRTVVVHHGCAKTHYERDPSWRTPETLALVEAQDAMFGLPNRWYVAPSEWIAGEFRKVAAGRPYRPTVIPNYAEPFVRTPESRVRPVVIGDWRNPNKGLVAIERIRAKMRDVEFRQLAFAPEKKSREDFYRQADAYLCLSLSEGAPYAVADAEACGLPIVSTDVGFVGMFGGMHTFPWKKRDDPDVAIHHLRKALREKRSRSSYFEVSHTLDRHLTYWHSLIERVFRGEPDAAGSVVISSGEVKRVAVSLAGGIGNSLFNLPLLHALKSTGLEIVGCVDTDSPTTELWKRCVYLDEVVEMAGVGTLPAADAYLSGPWRARGFTPTHQSKWKHVSLYHAPEWSVLLEMASSFGWKGSKPDVSGWCRGLKPPSDSLFTQGAAIVPGCKPGDLWERKKYPRMGEVAKKIEALGYVPMLIGTQADRDSLGEGLVGIDCMGKTSIELLPDLLAGCAFIIGTDSGAAHLGASLGIPTVMIYTATSPVKGEPVGRRFRKIYRPLPCSPCQSTKAWQKCSDWICRDIEPDDIVEAALEMLGAQTC